MLGELGYVEGKNIAFEYRYADNKLDRLPALADELVRLKVGLIVAPGMPEALAAKNATRTIPIVFLIASDPVAAGLVDSLARPGENITGFTTVADQLAGKRLELLKETVPKLSRVACYGIPRVQLYATVERKSTTGTGPGSAASFHGGKQRRQIRRAFKEAIKAHSAGLAVISGSLTHSIQKRVADLAIKNRLPAIYSRGDWVASGGLMSYGADRDRTPQARSLYDRQNPKGSKPADLPVEQPMKFDLIINLKTARQLSLTIPPMCWRGRIE